jgi:hypothetical protein
LFFKIQADFKDRQLYSKHRLRLNRAAMTLVVIAACSCFVLRADPLLKPEPGTALEGAISVGPTRGGPSRIGVPDSAPLANTGFVVKKGSDVVASFTTDDQGRFRIALPPGHYAVSIKEQKSKIGRYGPFEVDLAAGQVNKVQWTCDTGMR